MPRLIAIDLGSHRVKLAVYEGGFGRYQLDRLLAARVEADDEPPGAIGPRLAALQTLRAELDDKQRPDWVAAWPGQHTSLRSVRLPFADKAQIQRVLPFEVEGMVPFDLETVELRHRVVSASANESRVLAAMAEREPLREWLQALAGAGADPRSVDFDLDLLGELAGEGTRAVVDLGHRRTLVALCVDGQVQAARALDHGGLDLTRAIARATGLDLASAEALKHRSRLPAETAVQVEWEGEETTSPGREGGPPTPNLAEAPPAVDVGALLLAGVEPLLAELRSTLIGFEDQLGVGVDELLLVGGGAHLGGLRERIQLSFGVPTRLLAPPAPSIEATDAGSWGLVVALGQRAQGGKEPALELRRGPLAFKGDMYLARQVGLYGGVFAACALLAGGVVFGVRAVQLDRAIAELDRQILAEVKEAAPQAVSGDQPLSPTRALAILAEQQAAVQGQVDSLGNLLAKEPPTVALLRDLSRALPPHKDARIDVEELTITTSNISMKAETDGYEAATKIESRLQASEAFKGAKKGEEKKTRDGAISFTLNIPRGASSPDAGEEG